MAKTRIGESATMRIVPKEAVALLALVAAALKISAPSLAGQILVQGLKRIIKHRRITLNLPSGFHVEEAFMKGDPPAGSTSESGSTANAHGGSSKPKPSAKPKTK